jgi:hypothetical protein
VESRSARSSSTITGLPPRSSLPRKIGTTWYCWRHRPYASDNRAGRGLPEPVMKATVQLHQFATMRFPFPPLPIGLPPPCSPPQPTSVIQRRKRLGMHHQSIVAGQVALPPASDRNLHRGCAPVPPPPVETPPQGPVRNPSAVSITAGVGPSPAESRLNPFGLPITHLQQLCRLSQPQVPRSHSSHDLAPAQLLRAQLVSPQSESLLAAGTQKWTFLLSCQGETL